MPFTDMEESKFSTVAAQLHPSYEGGFFLSTVITVILLTIKDPKYNSELLNHLSQDEVARFKKWQSEQRVKRFEALFDHRNTPSTIELVDALKSIDFAVSSTFAKFRTVALQSYNTPRIPLIKNDTHDFSVQLGASMGSPGVGTDAYWPIGWSSGFSDGPHHKYIEEFIPTSLYPLRPDPLGLDLVYILRPGTDSPIKYGFSIGKIMVQTLQDKRTTIKDTGFVLVLRAIDKSLWMLHDYFPLDENGGPVQYRPVEDSVLAMLFKFPRNSPFDCLQLHDSINQWDPNKPLAEIPFAKPPGPLQGLISVPANSELFNGFISAQSSPSSVSAPQA
jgi:hypothetical protein